MSDLHVICAGFDPDTGGSGGGSGFALVTKRKVLAIGINKGDGVKRNGLPAVRHQVATLRKFLRPAFSLGKIDRIAIEIPIDYGQKRFARPEDLMRLSIVCGAAAAISSEFVKAWDFVEPWQWKGQRPKQVDQRNTLTYFGWDFEWSRKQPNKLPIVQAVPEDVTCLSDVHQKDMSEIVDAMGIALWCLHREGAA